MLTPWSLFVTPIHSILLPCQSSMNSSLLGYNYFVVIANKDCWEPLGAAQDRSLLKYMGKVLVQQQFFLFDRLLKRKRFWSLSGNCWPNLLIDVEKREIPKFSTILFTKDCCLSCNVKSVFVKFCKRYYIN